MIAVYQVIYIFIIFIYLFQFEFDKSLVSNYKR
jgi:hypothetical protein